MVNRYTKEWRENISNSQKERFKEVCYKECENCGNLFRISPSHFNKRKTCGYDCRNKLIRCFNTGRTHFRRGNTPWNKNKFLTKNPKRRRQKYYRRVILEISDSPYCEICGESDKKLCVHHIDEDIHNNNLDNLKVLCYSCHSKIHNLYFNFPNRKNLKGGTNIMNNNIIENVR